MTNPAPETVQQCYSRRAIRASVRSFAQFAGLNRSRSAVGVLMHAASDGRYGLDGLDLILNDSSLSRRERVALVATMRAGVLVEIANLLGNQRLAHDDVERAGGLFELIESAFGDGVLSRSDRMHRLELLSETATPAVFGRAMLRSAPSGDDWPQTTLFRANTVNPWGRSGNHDPQPWHGFVNAIFGAAAVEPLEVIGGGPGAFDRILCASYETVHRGPLVSILIPTHNPGPKLGTALASLVAQTWTNCEFLLLDDGSDPAQRHAMRSWAERDPRVRVLHMEGNIGNYAARNIGLQEACGEFVTVHDDDDWSHPRKIETQARHLIANPGVLANMSHLIRASSELLFTRINSNPSWIQPNYSSLMYRRESVVEEVGYWDEVNRSADAEYRNRVTAATGAAPVAVGSAPMSFLRVRSGSLTHGEIQRAYLDPRRRWYDGATRAWHAESLAKGARLYLDPSARDRPFAVPLTMARRVANVKPVRLDVVYATDFRFRGGNTSASLNEIQHFLDHGLSVGLLQLDSPVLNPTNQLNPKVLETSRLPGVHVVSVKDDVHASTVIVRHPTVLQFVEPVRSNIRADRHVLIVNHAPAHRDGSEAHYEINDCVQNFAAVFGVTPQVAPESGVIRSCLAALLHTPMTDFDWMGIVRARDLPPRKASEGPPVLGRHARDAAEKWPSSAAIIRALYPTDGSRDVRILGGAQVAADRLGGHPEAWTVHAFGSRAPSDFLSEVDFWIYFHHENLIESFGMGTVEAMASGAVPILPPYMEPTFGEGALYSEPAQVQSLVDSVWSDPDRYAAHSRRAVDKARRDFAPEVLFRRLDSLVVADSPAV